MCPPLEENDVFARTFGIRECADGLCGLVVEASQQLVELLHAESFQIPLSVEVDGLVSDGGKIQRSCDDFVK